MQEALRFRLGGACLDKGRCFGKPVTEQNGRCQSDVGQQLKFFPSGDHHFQRSVFFPAGQ